MRLTPGWLGVRSGRPLRAGSSLAVIAFAALSGVAAAVPAGEPPAGASACTGCHAARREIASPGIPLAGIDAPQIVLAFAEFRAGIRPATVMDRIARGFDEEEIRAIAAWYAAQR